MHRRRNGCARWQGAASAQRAVAPPPTISEVKRTRGGLSGYCSGKVRRMEKMPPSHAVSSVPKMVPPHTCKFSSPSGLALTPSGGDCFMVFRSDIKRRFEAEVNIFAARAHRGMRRLLPRRRCPAHTIGRGAGCARQAGR